MSDTSTRSGLLWEVERILSELDEKPQILLMENVPQVHSADNVEDFNKWQFRLEELGYKNYWQDLIATDYGIPQTRNRTFMVSILGDYNYTFPKPIPLNLKLKDMLEDDVDEKYYLSEKMLEYITSKDDKYKVNENNLTINREIACSKTTREGNTRADTTDYICDGLPENFNIKNGCKQIYDLNYYNHEQSNRVYSPDYSSPTLRTKSDEAGTIKIEDKVNRLYGIFDKKDKKHQAGSVYDKEGLSPTIDTGTGGYRQPMIEVLKIKNATKQGYLEATEGDGIDISSRMEYHRGTVQKGKTQTLSTMGGENNGVVVNMKVELCNYLINESKVKENDVIRHNYTTSKDGNCIQSNNEAPTLDTRCDCLGVVVNDIKLKRGYKCQIKKEKEDVKGIDVIGNYSKSNFTQTSIVNKNGVAPTVTENHGQVTAISNNLRIRKLTPKECFRLMGVKDEDYEKVAKDQSDSSLYHLAGDSIVVNVLMAIFKEMF